MTSVSVNSKHLNIFNAKQFRESVSEPSSSNLYFTFGRCFPWTPSDLVPVQANTSIATQYEIWDNMIGGKRLVSSDISHAVPKFEWASGQVYYAYDNMTDSKLLQNGLNKFYVVTDTLNVYKCLSNNFGAQSTSKPTSTTTSSDFQTADGYIWKYMYTISASDEQRFMTDGYMPVKTLTLNDSSTQWTVQQQATDGAIHKILLTSNGSNYTSNSIYVSIDGDGTNANAYAIRNVTTNVISTIVVDNKGSGYSRATISIYGGGGTGATARAIIPPPGGHGKDPVGELGGSFLVINPRINNSESGSLTVENDFRQVCIVEDPYYYGTSNVASNTIISQLTEITLSGSSVSYVEDEYVYQGPSLANATFKGIVTEWDSTNNVIKLSNTEGTPVNELLIGQTSTAARYLSSIIFPDLDKYSGKMLYVYNIEPVERAIDQTESFKIILSF